VSIGLKSGFTVDIFGLPFMRDWAVKLLDAIELASCKAYPVIYILSAVG